MASDERFSFFKSSISIWNTFCNYIVTLGQSNNGIYLSTVFHELMEGSFWFVTNRPISKKEETKFPNMDKYDLAYLEMSIF